jgi:hypothetical protein
MKRWRKLALASGATVSVLVFALLTALTYSQAHKLIINPSETRAPLTKTPGDFGLPYHVPYC